MLLNTAYGYLYALVKKKKEEEETSLKTLISDDISNSGRTTVPFFRTPWVNPGQLSKPSSIPGSILSPVHPHRPSYQPVYGKRYNTKEIPNLGILYRYLNTS